MALLMPFYPGGSLKSHVKAHKLSASQIVAFATNMGKAVEHLHSKSIIHKDLGTL